jgi:hypothetical protein
MNKWPNNIVLAQKSCHLECHFKRKEVIVSIAIEYAEVDEDAVLTLAAHAG